MAAALLVRGDTDRDVGVHVVEPAEPETRSSSTVGVRLEQIAKRAARGRKPLASGRDVRLAPTLSALGSRAPRGLLEQRRDTIAIVVVVIKVATGR